MKLNNAYTTPAAQPMANLTRSIRDPKARTPLSVGSIVALDARMREAQQSVLRVLAYSPTSIEYLLERAVPGDGPPTVRELDAVVFDPNSSLHDVQAWAAGIRAEVLRIRNSTFEEHRALAVAQASYALGRVRLFSDDFDAVVAHAISTWPENVASRDDHLGLIRTYHQTHRRDRDHWLHGNIGLARSVAMRHQYRGLEYDDLVQEGCIGLLRAIDRFDVTRGWRFSTYAMWWIRHYIERAIHGQAALIRIPAHIRAGMRPSRADSYISEDKAGSADPVPMQTASPIPVALLILDSPAYMRDDDSSETTIDLIEGTLEAPEASVIQSDLVGHLHRLLNYLPPRQAHVLSLLYGLAGDEITLREAGELLGISGERVRQIREEALANLAEHYPFDDTD